MQEINIWDFSNDVANFSEKDEAGLRAFDNVMARDKSGGENVDSRWMLFNFTWTFSLFLVSATGTQNAFTVI